MHWPVRRIAVAEQSMEPALASGDWLLAWCGLPGLGGPRIRQGQIVIARHPGRSAVSCWSSGPRFASQAAGGWNRTTGRAAAVDSRTFGAVPRGLIVGRMLVRYHRARP